MLTRIARQLVKNLPSNGLIAADILPAARGVCTSASCLQQQQDAASNAQSPVQPGNAPRPVRQGWMADVPPAAKILGFAGAIPFLALTPQLLHGIPLLPAEWVANAPLLQVVYGASIASFLGGIHWALAMAEYGGRQLSSMIDNDRYLWSVSPCLLAWPAVVMPTGPGATVIALTLGACYIVDRRWTRLGALPHWYMKLRLPLTVAATIGMGATVAHAISEDFATAEQFAAERAKTEVAE